MTVLDEDAPDEEEFVVCALQSVMRTAGEMPANNQDWPFCTVVRVSGDDDPVAGTDDPVIQLDFYGKGSTRDESLVAAKTAAKQGHRRMMQLAKYGDAVTLSDDSDVSADFITTVLKPFRMAFEHDLVVRYTARYLVGLSYVTD